jgi:hypothetical protein
MPSRTTTTNHRPALLAAVLTAVLAGLLLGLVTVVPATATPPFALPDQITDQVGAVEGHTGEIQAALDELEAEYGIRMWVVFVDTFDGTDPQDPQAWDQTVVFVGTFDGADPQGWDQTYAWADQTFTATGLGTEDCLLAVAMTDREYGFAIPHGFPALGGREALGDIVAMQRIERATDRHLAEDSARAVITAASTMGQERAVARPSRAPQTLAVLVGVLAMSGLVIFLRVRSQREGPETEYDLPRVEASGRHRRWAYQPKGLPLTLT